MTNSNTSVEAPTPRAACVPIIVGLMYSECPGSEGIQFLSSETSFLMSSVRCSPVKVYVSLAFSTPSEA